MRNKAIQTRMREKIRLFPKNYLHEVLNYYELINDCFFLFSKPISEISPEKISNMIQFFFIYSLHKFILLVYLYFYKKMMIEIWSQVQIFGVYFSSFASILKIKIGNLGFFQITKYKKKSNEYCMKCFQKSKKAKIVIHQTVEKTIVEKKIKNFNLTFLLKKFILKMQLKKKIINCLFFLLKKHHKLLLFFFLKCRNF